MEQEANKAGSILTGWVSLCREILVRFIEQNFPTVINGMVGLALCSSSFLLWWDDFCLMKSNLMMYSFQCLDQ